MLYLSGQNGFKQDPYPRVKMPQATNLKLRRDMDLCPVGPGTVFNHVVQISAATRDRAILINKTEESRLAKIQKLMDKEHRFQSNVQSRVIERTTRSLKERQALLQLLSKEYKFDNFVTMQQGFDSNQIDTKKIARRYVIESRVFNSGFNMKAMRPEVHRKIRKLDPNEKHRSFKKKLLAANKQQNIEINRAMSNTTFYRMLHDREHWRDYNTVTKPKWTPADDNDNVSTLEIDTIKNQNVIGEISTTNVEATETDRNTSKASPANEIKEKSIVIEKRLHRPKQNPFGMTMRSLGPVYFQASVHTVQNPEIQVKDS